MNRGTWSVAAVAVALLAGQAFGQAWGPGGGGSYTVVDSNGRMVVYDANQWRKMASDRMRETLGATEEEWTVLEPKLEKVQNLSMEAAGGGMMGMGMFVMGMGGRGGESEVVKAFQALAKVLKDKDAAPGDIRSALQALRDARAKAKAALEEAQKELRSVLTLRQEAQLVQMGLLD